MLGWLMFGSIFSTNLGMQNLAFHYYQIFIRTITKAFYCVSFTMYNPMSWFSTFTFCLLLMLKVGVGDFFKLPSSFLSVSIGHITLQIMDGKPRATFKLFFGLIIGLKQWIKVTTLMSWYL